ncbi:Crp/Fnr family transcriptional regulator [Galbibacter mesophilus]|uniref:Crp/Fnr family transcriptional regulator n=1 Tax=Galbibacter mesophilus TaxID=379069 RepID=UPI00191EF798|nr:Crp/Fnr family transcriptional regulator [Galbibacter mesophilus]MCM5663901.1 Crp/Fnr family transcriptional regulator [Galbibacter mesophilus]
MSCTWSLIDVNLFNLLCPHKFNGYKQNHTFQHYNKDEYIYFEKDHSNKIFLIESGKVKIGYYTEDGREVVKSIHGKGDVFGEKAIIGEENRNEFALSITEDTSVCVLTVDTIHDLMQENKSFSLKIHKFIGLRFKRIERRLSILLFKDTKTRLMEFLKELSNEYGYDCPNTGNHIIKHPYTQKDMASLLGTSRPNLNCLFCELKEQNILDYYRKEIILYKNEQVLAS